MDDAYSIRLAKTELRDAYNQGNVDRVVAVYADAYSDMSAGLASFYGTEAKTVLKHRLKKLFMRYHVEIAVTIISIRIQGPLAFDWGWHKLTLTPRNGGRSITARTRYLEIWQKDAAGQWKIGIFLDNLDIPPQMPPKEVLAEMGIGPAVTARRSAGRRRSKVRTAA